VELKLGVDSADARQLLQAVHGHGDIKGTRKGFGEIYSGHFGMRGFNTFIGKARANSILTAIAWGMNDLASTISATVLPLNGSFLQYWVDLPPDRVTRRLIETAVAGRMNSENGTNHVYVPFKPAVTVLDAAQVDLQEAKARFILDSLGMENKPPELLHMADFMLNFLENIHPLVQREIYEKMKKRVNGSTPILGSDLEHIGHIEYILQHRRTIRDTEDLVWTLRNDDTLPDPIKSRKAQIEAWLFEFSRERFESVFRLLAEKIKEHVIQRGR
jgi:hypothetical protein